MLRKHMVQIALEKVLDADFFETDWQLKLRHALYAEHPDMAHYGAPLPDCFSDSQVSCS
jgi:hypothetical protein